MNPHPPPAPHPTDPGTGPHSPDQGPLSGPAPARERRGLEAVPPPRRTAWDAEELMTMAFPEPRWAVPGIICEGVTLLAGPPKVGKSWMGLGLALDIAAGRPALGSIPVDAGPVLYLALEDTPRRLQSRMRTVLAGRPAPAGLTLSIACPPMPAGGDEQIDAWLTAHPGARLVVIDVFAKVRGTPPAGVAAYDADYAAMGRIKRVADRHGVAVVLVHHVRKAAAEDFLATVSGTNGLAGAADAVLVLERARAQADGVLHVTGRDVDETDYALSFDPEAGAWRVLDGRAEDYLMRDARSMVLRYLRDYPGQRPKQIADALQLDPGAVRQTCRRMVADGQLHATPGGQYRPADGDTRDSSDSPDPESPSLLSLRHADPADLGEPE
ncbi:AAA family ATPase [Pseudonocardia bannensis]|uniref:AAA family ATPase n=1 Tax=Pseudonocardia bannensis TaxID=630973 RepID=A0A848DD62_9PSEU|nr:AAA family ATPase [Pseudonocardia bannensis]NMH90541.1 AAA family ATPase [Pseudonocardia bannensis]